MYKDIITYELADNSTEEQLLKIAGQIVKDWMEKQPGFLSWEIHTNNDGSYTDIVYWEDAAAAKKANDNMVNIPNAAAWYGCYKQGSISSKNLSLVSKF